MALRLSNWLPPSTGLRPVTPGEIVYAAARTFPDQVTTPQDAYRRSERVYITTETGLSLRHQHSGGDSPIWSESWACGDTEVPMSVAWGAPNPIATPGHPPTDRQAAAVPVLSGPFPTWESILSTLAAQPERVREHVARWSTATAPSAPARLPSAHEPLVSIGSGPDLSWTGDTIAGLNEFGPTASAEAYADWYYAYDEEIYDEATDTYEYRAVYELSIDLIFPGDGYDPQNPPAVTLLGVDGTATAQMAWDGNRLDSIWPDDPILSDEDNLPWVTVLIEDPPIAEPYVDAPPPGVYPGERVVGSGRITHRIQRTPDGAHITPLDGPVDNLDGISMTEASVWGATRGNLRASYDTHSIAPETYTLNFLSCSPYNMPACTSLIWEEVSADDEWRYPSSRFNDELQRFEIPSVVHHQQQALFHATTALATTVIPDTAHMPTMYRRPEWGDGSDPSHYSMRQTELIPYDNSSQFQAPPAIASGTIVVGDRNAQFGGWYAAPTVTIPFIAISMI